MLGAVSLFFDFDEYFSVLDNAAVCREGCCFVFCIFAVSYVEFPSVAGAHYNEVLEDSAFERASCVRALVLEAEDFVALAYE